jgi:hypothetical protein
MYCRNSCVFNVHNRKLTKVLILAGIRPSDHALITAPSRQVIKSMFYPLTWLRIFRMVLKDLYWMDLPNKDIVYFANLPITTDNSLGNCFCHCPGAAAWSSGIDFAFHRGAGSWDRIPPEYSVVALMECFCHYVDTACRNGLVHSSLDATRDLL